MLAIETREYDEMFIADLLTWGSGGEYPLKAVAAFLTPAASSPVAITTAVHEWGVQPPSGQPPCINTLKGKTQGSIRLKEVAALRPLRKATVKTVKITAAAKRLLIQG